MKRFCFLLVAATGMIAQASYAGGPVVTEPAQSVVVLGEEAVFVGGTNDLTAWASDKTPWKYRLTVFDRAGKKAVGYPGAIGREEKLGPEMLLDGAMELFTKKGKLSPLFWARSRCDATREMESLRPGTEGKAAVKETVVNGKNPWGANSGALSETISIENERLHKLSGWVKNGSEADSVFMVVHDATTGKQIMTPPHREKEWKEYVLYFVPSQVPILTEDVWVDGWVNLMVIGADGAFAYGDDLSLREVTAGGRNMIKIYTDRNGDKRGWAVVEEGFDPCPVSKCVIEEVN